MNRAARAIILFISQGAYVGRFPVAPGTAGTIVGLFFYVLMKNLTPAPYFALCIAIFFLGTCASDRAEAILGAKDSPSIVIDEIAGFLVAMFMVPASWGFIAAGFLLFRAFDIVKPWPLKRLQDLHGGLGVMLDDIGAGIYANLVLQAAAFFISR